MNDGAAKTGRNDSLEIVTTERTLYVYSEEPGEIYEWREALIEAINRLNGIAAPKQDHRGPRRYDSPKHRVALSLDPRFVHSHLKIVNVFVQTRKPHDGEKRNQTEIVVRGMSCECCERKIKSLLSHTQVHHSDRAFMSVFMFTLSTLIQGIEDYQIKLDDERVVIKGEFNAPELLGYLEAAGFLPSIE